MKTIVFYVEELEEAVKKVVLPYTDYEDITLTSYVASIMDEICYRKGEALPADLPVFGINAAKKELIEYDVPLQIVEEITSFAINNINDTINVLTASTACNIYYNADLYHTTLKGAIALTIKHENKKRSIPASMYRMSI